MLLSTTLKSWKKIGDHNVVSCCIETTKAERTTTRSTYNFRRANFDGLREDLEAYVDGLTEEEFLLRPLEETYSELRDNLIEISSRYIPMKTPFINNPSWFNNEVRAAIANRQRCYRERDQDEAALAAYTAA